MKSTKINLIRIFTHIYCATVQAFFTAYSYFQINLPESVAKRHLHSMTSYQISDTIVWVAVTGGIREYDHYNNTNIVVSGYDVTTFVELGMVINIMG